MTPRVSVVLTTYRRVKSLDRIIRAWLAEGAEVWLGDSSGGKRRRRYDHSRTLPRRHLLV